MVATQSVMLVTAALLALATLLGLESVWPIYVLSAFASAATAFDTQPFTANAPEAHVAPVNGAAVRFLVRV